MTTTPETDSPIDAATHSPAAASRSTRGPIVLAVVTAAALVTAGTVYVTMYRADDASSPQSTEDILTSANEGTVALLSYSPTQLDADFAAAKTHLTGQFLTYYEEFTTKVVTPAATENGVDTEAQVVRSAVSKHDGDSAEVLAFVNQTTTSTPKPEPELTSSSVLISLERVAGRWLISSFDPI